MYSKKALKVNIPTVENVISPGFVWDNIHYIDIVNRSCCDVDKCWYLRGDIVKACGVLSLLLFYGKLAHQKTLKHKSMVEESKA